MEASPPSYERATVTNAFDLVAKYLKSSDLCATALVCQSWYSTFAPCLWGNPAGHFGTENDRVYVALTRFKQTLPWARLYVRSFTHTLHLPPAHAEIYNGPQADWLREVLDRLPNLQTLIVRGLPFFDHSALLALKHRPEEEKKKRDVNKWAPAPEGAVELPAQVPQYTLPFQLPRLTANGIPTYGLRLLDASRCSNATSAGLSEALKRLDQLLYLDLSYTYAARDVHVLNSLKDVPGLQVLKLRGNNLRDEHIQALAPAISLRVRSLDVRNNALTDRSVRALLLHCFVSPNAGNEHGTPSTDRSSALLQHLGPDMFAIYQGEDFEAYLRNAFTTSFVSRLAIEDAPSGGITHLYIADNSLTVEGVSGLLRSERLHVLDARVENRLVPASPVSPTTPDSLLLGPGAEKLAHLFVGRAGDCIRHLKISHDIVTKKPSKVEEESVVHGKVELSDCTSHPLPQGFAEMGDTSVVEMPADTGPPIYELSAEPELRSELPGDSLQMTVTPAIGKRPQPTQKELDEYEKARRGSVTAPEVVTDSLETPASFLHPSTAESSDTSGPATPLHGSSSRGRSRPRTYSNLERERGARSRYMTQTEGLHPALMPHMKTLTLTNFPAFSATEESAQRFIRFIEECAVEARSARQQARFDYAAPPGRRQAAIDIREAGKAIFGLQVVIIEVAPEPKQRKNSLAARWTHAKSTSMTGDRDSQNLWSASESDFSFFGEDEEVMFPSLEPQARTIHSQALVDKQIMKDMAALNLSSSSSRQQQQGGKPTPPLVDNIARISQFRKSKKAEYQNLVRAGEKDPDVEGYWPGVVQVVRNSGNDDPFAEEDESLDYFGNSFSKGYLYK